MKSNQRDGPVIAGGIGVWVLVAALTIFAVIAVVNKLNDNADKAYAAALDYQFAAQSGQTDGKVPSITGPSGSNGEDDNNSGQVTDTDNPNEGELSVEDGQATGETQQETESNEESNPGGNDTADVSSEGDTEGDAADAASDGTDASGDDSSDSINSTDVGTADGKNFVGIEYLSIGPDGTTVYHIVWGDTLCDISRKLGFSVDELADYNKIRDVNLIYAESLMRVPLDEETLEALRQAQAQNPDEKVHASVNTGPEEEYD